MYIWKYIDYLYNFWVPLKTTLHVPWTQLFNATAKICQQHPYHSQQLLHDDTSPVLQSAFQGRAMQMITTNINNNDSISKRLLTIVAGTTSNKSNRENNENSIRIKKDQYIHKNHKWEDTMIIYACVLHKASSIWQWRCHGYLQSHFFMRTALIGTKFLMLNLWISCEATTWTLLTKLIDMHLTETNQYPRHKQSHYGHPVQYWLLHNYPTPRHFLISSAIQL